jgi:hypothetical protein
MRVVAVRLPRGKGFTKPKLFEFKNTKNATGFIRSVKKAEPKAEFLIGK